MRAQAIAMRRELGNKPLPCETVEQAYCFAENESVSLATNKMAYFLC